ncbi:MAG: SIS domain-containing protein [Acidobacteriota bacterium]|nr:SIS domain-containing protein [Acidobacteriota bacterium]
MKFPIEVHGSAAEYWARYSEAAAHAVRNVDTAEMERAAEFLYDLFCAGRTLYVCGNGGSAAISNHLLCDFAKGIQTDTPLKPRVVSLASHLELITAIGNDFEFAEIFSYQLRTFASKGDALMTISASGNSENIVRAVEWAKQNGVGTIALTGFDGGRSAELADINLHVPARNYGIVEDVHQSMMHVFAQYLRMRRMDPALVEERHF